MSNVVTERPNFEELSVGEMMNRMASFVRSADNRIINSRIERNVRL